MKRNNVGSLDLGVEQMKAAAAVQQARAIAAREVATATALAAREEGDYSAEARAARAATEALAIQEEKAARQALSHAAALEQVQERLNRQASATDAVVVANRRGTDAFGAVNNSVRAGQVAMAQLGQQMQDMVVQAQMGTSAITIFTQQVPQAAYALTGLAGSASKTQAAIGRFALFLSGPWGAAIFAATAILGPFIAGLFETADAADKAGDSFRSAAADARDLIGAMNALALNQKRMDLNKLTEEQFTLENSISKRVDPNAAYWESRGRPDAQKDRLREIKLEKARLESLIAIADRENAKIEADAKNKDRHKKSSDGSAKAAEREAKALEGFGDRSAESIQRINEQFNEQPKLIDQAAQATRKLDDIIKDLSERKPAGFQQMIKDAQDTKAVVQDALIRPFREFDQDAERRVQVQRLMVTGREDEADALQAIWSLESRLGPLSEERKQHVRETVIAENEAMRALEGQRTIMEAYLDTTRSVRTELENLFQGKTVNFKDLFKQLQSKVLVEQLFGPALRSLEDYVKQNTFGPAVDDLSKETKRAGGAVGDFADAMDTATQRILNGPSAANDNYVGGGGVSSILAMGLAQVKGSGAAGSAGMAGLPQLYLDILNKLPISVTGPRLTGGEMHSILKLSPEAYFARMAQSIVKPFTSALDEALGVKFFAKLDPMLSGAFTGYMTGGSTGGLLGALQGVVGANTKLGKILGKGMEGAATGTMISGIGNMLGLKMSDTGAQIGGALGSALPIPGGAIIGSVVGGLIGKLFHSAKWGNATLSGGNLNLGSNQADMGSAAGSAGNEVQSALEKIASSLGATVGNYLVSIGVTDNKWRISTTGRTGELKSKYSDVTVFGTGDAAYAEAVKAAIADAIKDGAIQGLRATTQRIIQMAKDVDTGVQNAIDFESVFKRLREYKDPVGAAIDTLDAEFKRLKGIFDSAGATVAEYAQLEELYGIERAKAIKEANDKIISSIRSLYEDLTIGDSGLSLRERLANAQAKYDPLKARVMAGDTTAYDDFAQAARDLLDIERQMYGSQSPYFDLFNEIKNLSKSVLDGRGAIDAASTNSDSPFTSSTAATATANDNQVVVNALGQLGLTLLDGLTPQLAAVNLNLDRIGRIVEAGTNNPTPFPSFATAANYF
ncbi:hypothetical protein [Novosphingobium sp.]|uniref:hypothetical protein n=1 Tax=Novosphingobium sp. TaxID=1874826 RepID=UPI0035B0F816